MTASSGSALQQLQAKFADILLIELQRQDVSDASAWSNMLYPALRIHNGAAVVFAFSQMGLHDRVVLAIVETIMRISPMVTGPTGVQGLPSAWNLALAGNKLDDRVADSLCLLLRSCGQIVRIDLTGNNFSPVGASKIRETVGKLAKQPVVLLDTAVKGATETQQHGGGSVGSGISHGSSSIDIAALRRRRDRMFYEEGLESSEQAKAKRASLRAEVDVASQSSDGTPRGPAGGTKAQQQTPPVATAAKQPSVTPAPKPSSQNEPTATPPQHSIAGATTTANPQSKKQTKQAAAARKATSGWDDESDGDSSEAVGPAKTTTTAKPPPKSKPSVATTTTNTGKQQQQQPTSKAKGTEPHQHHQHKPSKDSRSISRDYATGANPQQRITTPDADAYEEVEDERTRDLSELSTTATEIPDQHDYLDVTLNLGPLDAPLSLMAVGLPPEDILSPERFQNITVLNIAQNGLEQLAALPPTLVRLDASSNALVEISGLEECTMLSVLNLRRNMILKIGGLDDNLNITHLFLGRNRIRYVDNLAHLWMLEVLDLGYNTLEKESHIRPLSMNPVLHQLILEGNPIQKKLAHKYKTWIRNLCTPLLVLDNVKLSYSRHADATNKLERSMAAMLLPHSALNTTGAPVGYAAPGKVAQSMAAIRSRQQSLEKEKQMVKVGTGPHRRRVTRQEVVQRLQQQNQSMIEATVVERLSQMRDTSHAMQMTREDVVQAEAADEEAEEEATETRQHHHHRKQQRRQHTDPWYTKHDSSVDEAQSDYLRAPSAASSKEGGVDDQEAFQRIVARQQHQAAGGGLNYSPQLRSSKTIDDEEWQRQRRHTAAEEAFLRNVSTSHSPPQGQGPQPLQYTLTSADSVNVTPQAAELSFGGGSMAFESKENVSAPTAASGVTTQQRPYPLLEEQKKRVTSPHGTRGRAPLLPSTGTEGKKRRNEPIVSPPPVMAGSPHGDDRHVRFSPIRSDLNRTDVSVMQFATPGGGQQPTPARAPVTDPDQWLSQMKDDTAAARVALRTLLVVLESTKETTTSLGGSGEPSTTCPERQRCIDIIKRGHLTSDTDIPASVVRAFNLTEEELNDPAAAERAAAILMQRRDAPLNRTVAQRCEALDVIHALSEVKTCLRYIVALVDNERWDLLDKYVGQLRESSQFALSASSPSNV